MHNSGSWKANILKSSEILDSAFWKAKILKSAKIVNSGFWKAKIFKFGQNNKFSILES